VRTSYDIRKLNQYVQFCMSDLVYIAKTFQIILFAQYFDDITSINYIAKMCLEVACEHSPAPIASLS